MALWINESTSSMNDFMTKLGAFLTTAGAGNPGWTAEDTDGAGNEVNTTAGTAAWSKATGVSGEYIQVAFQWDTASDNYLGVYQYYDAGGTGSYVRANNPWGQTGDSGMGFAGTTDASLDLWRRVEITDTPVQYWCFTGDYYAYVVVEFEDGKYSHFGFGRLTKFNDWTGGEFAYGNYFNPLATLNVGVQITAHCLLDGYYTFTSTRPVKQCAATIRIEDMTDSPTNGLWGVVCGDIALPGTNLGQDRQGTPEDRIHLIGGFRGGFHAAQIGDFQGTISQGYTTSYPIVIYHWDQDISGSTPAWADDSIAPLGYMPGVRGVSIENFAAEDEITVGSDTWVLFPTYKRYEGTLLGTSGYQGIMYKKN